MSKYEYTTGPTERFLPEEEGDFLIHRTRVTIVPKGDPLFSLRAVDVQIDSDAGEEYVTVRQQNDDGDGESQIQIYRDEWPVLRKVIDTMVARCRVEKG